MVNPNQRFSQNQGRSIRVFISSTFQDMQAEREELVKRVFPHLRKLCEERNIIWGEVDLRWGINDEQKAEGKVLPICLEEIQRCRPFFIGMLGERYGWVSDTIPEDIAIVQPWLKEHISKSITELEILHGVLNNPEMAEQAFFYFRDPAYIDTLPQETRNQYREVPLKKEIDQFGEIESSLRANERKEKLCNLKDQIRKSNISLHENYRNPQELGDLVLTDFIKTIDTLFPLTVDQSHLEKERNAHLAYARSRHNPDMEYYVGRKEYFEQVDEQVLHCSKPLIILGESGSGKSALIANWMSYYQKINDQKPPDLEKSLFHTIFCKITGSSKLSKKRIIIYHVLGATKESLNAEFIMKRVISEINYFLNIQISIPDDPKKLHSTFVNALSMAAAKSELILILDGLDLIEDYNNAPDLDWIPAEIPANVRLIVSAAIGQDLTPVQKRVHDALRRREWKELIVQDLTSAEREQVLVQYLKQYGRYPAKDLIQRIVTADQTKNPLFLTLLLEEMRLYGDRLTLSEYVESYLEAKTIPELYEKILSRYEKDYELDRPGLVRDAFSHICSSRRGLSESELLELLGFGGKSLPHAYWASLSFACNHHLISRSGLIDFAHSFFRQAISSRYLHSKDVQDQEFLTLARYFERVGIHQRGLEETPWLFVQAKSWQNLIDLLTDQKYVVPLSRMNEHDLNSYWSALESESDFRMVSVFEPVISNPALYDDDYVFNTAALLLTHNHFNPAQTLLEYLSEVYRKKETSKTLIKILDNLAALHLKKHDFDSAVDILKEQQSVCRKIGVYSSLTMSYGRFGIIAAESGNLGFALAFLKIQEQMAQKTDNKLALQESYGNKGVIFMLTGLSPFAARLFKKQEKICRETGNLEGLQSSLFNQALLFDQSPSIDNATMNRGMELLKEQERICRQIGLDTALPKSFNAQGSLLLKSGDFESALVAHKEAEQISRRLNDVDELGTSLINQAHILQTKGDLTGAIKLLKDMEYAARQNDNAEILIVALRLEGNAYRKNGDLDTALTLFKEMEKVVREKKADEALSAALLDQAVVLKDLGKILESKKCAEEALHLAKEQGYNTHDIEGILRQLNEQSK